MNIFVLSENPIKAARMQHDKHIVKMVLETAQMLCSAFENAPYKKTYINNPCTVWARTSRNNFDWLVLHGLALATEYTYRYNKTHASEKVISWCYKNADLIKFPKKHKTPHPLAMPKQYKTEDPVESYINYYINEKLNISKWTRRVRPSIFSQENNYLFNKKN